MHTETKSIAPKSAPSIRVGVTAGNIRNGHVYVRECLWFFPKEAMRGEKADAEAVERCVLELPGLGTIESDIDSAKGIFRWRGWKRFFRLHNVKPGDRLVFTRRDKRTFSVSVEHDLLEGIPKPDSGTQVKTVRTMKRSVSKRCNDLSGDEWLRYSISVWSDIRKTHEEAALGHPAMFPTALCDRLITMLLRRRGKHRVLDPFLGSGSVVVAARNLGKLGIGLELNPEYLAMAKQRLDRPGLFHQSAPGYELHEADARRLLEFVPEGSVDLCITSPPYWDILNQERTADYKDQRNYGDLPGDLSGIHEYGAFIAELGAIFDKVYLALRRGGYCVVIVMDIRKKDSFYPFHSDLAERVKAGGFVFEDIIIWNRGSEYNNLRPLGYPSVFRINKVHEYILIFRKR